MRSPEFLQSARQGEADANIAFSQQVAQKRAADRVANAPRDQRVAQAALAQMAAANAAVPSGQQAGGAAMTPAGFNYDAASGGAPQAPVARGYAPPRAVVPDDVTAGSDAESQANANRIAAIRQAMNDQRYGWMGTLAEEYTGTPQDRWSVARPRREAEKARAEARADADARADKLLRQRMQDAAGRRARQTGY